MFYKLSRKNAKILSLIDYNDCRIIAYRQSPIEMVFKVIFSLFFSPQKTKKLIALDNPHNHV